MANMRCRMTGNWAAVPGPTGLGCTKPARLLRATLSVAGGSPAHTMATVVLSTSGCGNKSSAPSGASPCAQSLSTRSHCSGWERRGRKIGPRAQPIGAGVPAPHQQLVPPSARAQQLPVSSKLHPATLPGLPGPQTSRCHCKSVGLTAQVPLGGLGCLACRQPAAGRPGSPTAGTPRLPAPTRPLPAVGCHWYRCCRRWQARRA